MEDNRPTLDEVCMEYEECIEECPAYGFCHSKAESEEISERNMKMWQEIFKAESEG